MVTEKPPRRPKPKKEPVTIDLAAEEAAAVAEPVRSNDTDDVTPAEREAPWGEATTPEEPTSTAEPSDQKPAPDHANEPPVSEPVEATVTEPPAADIPAADQDRALHDQAKPETVSATHRAPTDRKDAATSTLIAAGIFGGIVALALAGSMQYAGYLPAASSGSNVSAELADLRREVAAINQAPTPAADPELQARVQALETSLSQNTDDETPERLSAIEREIASARSAAESGVADSTAQLQQLRARLDAAEAKLNEPGADAAAARAIAAAALQAAVDRGGAFTAELDTYAAVAPEDPALAELRSMSETGIPSRPQLVERFQQAGDAILETVNRPDPEQGIAGRLVSSAMSVVKVRRTGEVEGDAPDALVARIDTALKNGNLQAAAQEWEKLPEEAKAASQNFKQSLDARIAVDALIGDSVTRAVSETGNRN